MITGVNIGDVMAVRTGGIGAWWIRFGAAFRDLPNLDNHVAVLHHKTGDTWWAIEGKPGGVGWVNANNYLNSPYTITNRNQPKTDEQRALVCEVMEAMLHTPYDWPAIAQDAMFDLHLETLWDEKWNGQTPGHVVCSSLAVWGYEKAALNYPKTQDPAHVQPGDWTKFSIDNKYA